MSSESLIAGAVDEVSTRASLQRRWWFVLPAVFVTYSLAYLDRANYGFGAAAGLAQTLHITDTQSSLLGSLFFLGYFAFQIPGAIFARRRSAVRLIFVSLVLWGVLAALTGVIREFWLLAVDRFLLGTAESFVFPALLLLLTRWFVRAERSRANTLLMLGNPTTVLWMSAITGYLIQAYGWQRTFVLEGVPAVVWAVIWMVVMRDKPSESRWMTAEATELLERQLTAEQMSVAPVGALSSALLRGDVLLLSVHYFFWSVGVYGFVIWLPTIIRLGGSFSMGKTGLLAAIPYLVAIVLMLMVAHFSDKTLNRKAFVWPFLLVSGLAMLCSYLFSARSFSVAFVSLIVAGACMYAPYGCFFAIIPERVSRNVTAEVLAMVNCCGALGAFFGSYFVGFLQGVTGNSRAGFLLMSLSLMLSALLLYFLPKPPQAVMQMAGIE